VYAADVSERVKSTKHVVPVERDLGWIKLPGAVLVASVAPFLAFLLGAGDLYAILAGVSAFVALVTAAVRLINAPLVRRSAVEAHVDDTHLVLGARRVPRKTLTRGVATPVADGALVQLRTSSWAEPIVLHLADPKAADELLAELDLDVSERAAHFWAQSTLVARPGYVAAVVLGGLLLIGLMVYGIGAEWPRTLVLGLAGLYAAISLGAGLPVSVSVGLDGVNIRRVTGSEFLPWSSVVAVRAIRERSVLMDAGAIEIEVLGRAKPLRLPLATDRISADTPERLAARIEDARRAAARDRPALALSGPMAERVRKARAVLGGTAGYRDAQTPPEAVHRLVLDPSADPADRVAAAVALRDTEEGRARVRVAAATTAERSLRVALASTLAEAAEEASDLALAERSHAR
jgi:hypothetical protein